MVEFDWGLVKDAALYCRSQHGGKLPAEMFLCLPRSTNPAIADAAEMLFPHNEVVIADVEVPIFLREIPPAKNPTLDDRLTEVLGRPPTPKERQGFAAIIAFETTKIPVKADKKIHSHTFVNPHDHNQWRTKRLFVLAGSHHQAEDYIRGSTFVGVKCHAIGSPGGLQGLRWEPEDQLVLWGTWWERRDILDIVAELHHIGFPDKQLLSNITAEYQRHYPNRFPEQTMRGLHAHNIILDEELITPEMLERMKKIYQKRNPRT